MTVAVLPLPLDEAPRHHVLHPGDVVCASRGDHLETLLGSCVAVLLTDRRRTVGALCHIVHAGGSAGDPTTYAAPALARMQALLQKRAIVLRLCQAWVIGGGNMFPGHYDSGHVGDANARWVLQALAADGVQLAGHELGGPHYRRLRWTVGPELPQVTAVTLPE